MLTEELCREAQKQSAAALTQAVLNWGIGFGIVNHPLFPGQKLEIGPNFHIAMGHYPEVNRVPLWTAYL